MLGGTLPFSAAFIFCVTYLIFHVFFGVPVNRILSPYLAFCALTLAMQLALFWAMRYGARIESAMPSISVVAAYGLLLFPVWVHFALSLGIGDPKAIVRAGWMGGVVLCLGFLLHVVLRRQKARR